ncbi:hypothetical protein [Nocardioides sp. MH1]|uniref:hypothetical protein n=1 Tax=Nocardioides sp. MH1 TaxID=3242490 RepID=UPI00352236E2
MEMRVRVMHDYGCWPLWVKRHEDDIHHNTRPETLGLSSSLVGRLGAWQQWGDSKVNLADPHDSRAVSRDEEAAFEAEGRLLVERVRSELPSAIVYYRHDEPW